MRNKFIILIYNILALNIYSIYAQDSPIKFLNSIYTINVDTSFHTKYFLLSSQKLRYKFINIGEHVTFIDSSLFQPYITKPNDTTTIILECGQFYKSDKYNIVLNKDTSSFIYIPFYYEGKIYNEKLVCRYTFGKSKLIEYDNPVIKVDNEVSKFFPNDNEDTITKVYPNRITFTIDFLIKNITDKPIWCTRDMIGYYDCGIRDRNRYDEKYVIIPSYGTYNIPIRMHMYDRYQFTKTGQIEVFSDDTFETFNFKVKSEFNPKGKYVYQY